MTASRAPSHRVMIGPLFQCDFLFTIGAVAVPCPALAVIVEDVVFLNTHLIDPTLPVLRQRRCLRELRIPRIGFLSVPAFQFSITNGALKFQNSPIYAFFIRRQILPDLCIIHGADPHVIGSLRLPLQIVDLCRPPLVTGTVIGEKLLLFFLHENLIDRQRSAKAHCIRVIQGDFQNAALYRASYKTAVSASIESVPARTDLDRHILTGNRKHFFSRRQILHFQQTAFFHFCTASLFTKSMSYHTPGWIFSPSTSATAI